MNRKRFVKFLKRLIYKRTNPEFLVFNGYFVHKSKQVTDFVESTDGRLRLFILPPYFPHLNPDKWVWNWLKNHKFGRKLVSGPNQFRFIVKRHLRQLSKPKYIVKVFSR
jgi:transposase